MIPKYWTKYRTHKNDAKNRKIGFLLTYEEWLQIWQDSGHLHERGRKSKQFCMARFGDQGPYAVGNVKIITNNQNATENRLGKSISESHKLAFSKANKGKPKSEEHKRKLSEFHKTNELAKENLKKMHLRNTGKKATAEARKKRSEFSITREVWKNFHKEAK